MYSYLGIDLGASSIKVSLFDTANGSISTTRQSIATQHPQRGWAEQKPQDWLDGLKLSIDQLRQNRKNTLIKPSAISVSAGAHIPVLLDRYYKPLRAAILWSDQRSGSQADWLERKHGEYIRNTCFNTPSPTWSISMLLWLRQYQAETCRSARYLIFAKDYIRLALGAPLTTDPGDATGSMLYNRHQLDWDARLLDICQLDIEKLPPIQLSTRIIGETTTRAEKFFGIASGVPLVNGTIDTTAELLCTGAINEGDRVIKLASAGVYSWLSDKIECRAPVSCYPNLSKESCYYATGSNSCMTSVDWFGKHIATISNWSLAEFDHLVSCSKSANLPLFHPYISGERAPIWNANVRGSFSMISLDHQLADLAKAVYLGICFSIRHLMEQSGNDNSSGKIWVIGGGTVSEQLCQMLANVIQESFITSDCGDASVGSAILAALATGNFVSFTDMKIGTTRNWYPEQCQYQQRWQEYLALTDFLNSSKYMSKEL